MSPRARLDNSGGQVSFDGRITKLEREVGPKPADRSATYAMVIDDRDAPVDPEELARFLEAIAPAGTLRAVCHLDDNGRGPRGPHISFGGPGWVDAGPDIQDGHILGDWRWGA
jgi:hypothetical protein